MLRRLLGQRRHEAIRASARLRCRGWLAVDSAADGGTAAVIGTGACVEQLGCGSGRASARRTAQGRAAASRAG